MEGTLSRLIACNQNGQKIKTQQRYQQQRHTSIVHNSKPGIIVLVCGRNKTELTSSWNFIQVWFP